MDGSSLVASGEEVGGSASTGYSTRGRPQLTRQLDALQDAILALGSMVDKAVDLAGEAIAQRDVRLAGRIIEEDLWINRQRLDVEAAALRVLATQQPMASDLRFVAAVLHIATDLERIGDHARGVARLTCRLSAEAPVGPVTELPALGALGRARLRRALDALIARDADLARRVAAEDAEIDRLQGDAYVTLLGRMRTGGSPDVAATTHLLSVVHNFERIGDHVTNVCEWIIYVVTGRMVELSETALD
jgi:phosphate transport system protein